MSDAYGLTICVCVHILIACYHRSIYQFDLQGSSRFYSNNQGKYTKMRQSAQN